jgi:Replication stress response SDE2 C-terminal/Silencing defective 2 N-terminal ubiquitin domain/SPRY domain
MHQLATRTMPHQQQVQVQVPQQLLVRFNDKTHVWNRPLYLPTGSDTFGCGGCRSTECHEEEEGERQGLIEAILAYVASTSGWPKAALRVASLNQPFCSVVAASSIRGGKGGFGTLLKGQSRQAANQTTLDYGSCRDLQGRRLRSVNDEIAQRLHREWQQRVDTGQATPQQMVQALSDTSSGIAGWFLQLPAWAEKGTRKVARRQHHKQYQAWKRSEQDRTRAKELQRQAEDRVVASYVQSTQKSLEDVTSHLHQAVQQGLLMASQKQQQQTTNPQGRKRKLSSEDEKQPSGAGDAGASDVGGGLDNVEKAAPEEDVEDDDEKELESDDSDPPSAYVTLSGEVVQVPTEETKEGDEAKNPACPKLQGASNFATIGVLLRDSLNNNNNNNVSSTAPGSCGSLYYELVVHTGGLVQVGWVSDPSALDSEAGDGAGDVPGSWSYDGSRQIKIMGSKPSTTGAATATTRAATAASASQSAEYGVRWKAGDVVGCLWNPVDRSLRYFVNGDDLGIAFEGVEGGIGDNKNNATPPQQPALLVPAVSINPEEVVEFRLHRKYFQYYPVSEHNATPVGEMLLEQVLSTEPVAGAAAPATSTAPAIAPATGAKIDVSDHDTKPAAATDSVEQQNVDGDNSTLAPIDLGDFGSIDSLELLGLDRLKAALQARGLKCGGTARERATRLFAVKGLASDQYPARLVAKK